MQYVEPKNNYLACLFSKYTFKYLIYNSAHCLIKKVTLINIVGS